MTTLVAALAALTAVVLCARIALALVRDALRAAEEADVERITAGIAPPLLALTAAPHRPQPSTEPWPERQTPTDLAAAYAPVHWSPVVATTPPDYVGGHRTTTTTGEFAAIVAREWPTALRPASYVEA